MVIGKVIEICRNEWVPIPKWLLFTLSHTLLLDSKDPLSFYLELEVIHSLRKLLDNKPIDNECIISGSVVTGLVYYGATWKGSDVDLFIKEDGDYQHTKAIVKFRGVKWDIIQLCENVPLCWYVGKFDQSLVQMCLPEGEQVLQMTPLALFTKRTKIVIITLTGDNLYYMGANQTGMDYVFRKPSVENLLHVHRKEHAQKEKGIHECGTCYQTTNQSLKTWIKRMEKYVTRFPGYRFIYLLS